MICRNGTRTANRHIYYSAVHIPDVNDGLKNRVGDVLSSREWLVWHNLIPYLSVLPIL